jgi:hypothetical protein
MFSSTKKQVKYDAENDSVDELEQSIFDKRGARDIRRYSSSEKDNTQLFSPNFLQKLTQNLNLTKKQQREYIANAGRLANQNAYNNNNTNNQQQIQSKFVNGDYTIQVHIIEARDLRGKDYDDKSDPFVLVKILDQEKSTNVKSQTLNCIFDVLYFDLDDVTSSKMANTK